MGVGSRPVCYKPEMDRCSTITSLVFRIVTRAIHTVIRKDNPILRQEMLCQNDLHILDILRLPSVDVDDIKWPSVDLL